MLDATPLLRIYAAWRSRRLRAEDPVEAQRRTLLDLIGRAKDTRFGRDHGFAEINDIESYQERVPLRSFDAFWSDYWESEFPKLENCTWPGLMPFFAETSGTTTGRTKYIPCSHEMNRANRRAALDIMVHHLANRPKSRILGGRSFMLGGSTGLRDMAPGVRSGDLSGIAAATIPGWARLRYFPPPHIEAITDWEERLDALVGAVIGEDIRSISGTPSWLLILFERLKARYPERGETIRDFFPHLEGIVHGAVQFAPYRPAFAEWLAGSDVQTREVYAASEGFVAIADRGDGEGMRLILDNGLFYEFVAADEIETDRPRRLLLGDVELDVDYALVLTSNAGVWSYVLGDTVRFVDLEPPRLIVSGRTSFTLSAFGEHVIVSEIDEAVTAAAEAIGAQLVDFTVGAIFPDGRDARGGHIFLVEFHEPIPAADAQRRFIDEVDRHLAGTNDDYRAHRTGMLPPRLEVLAPGTFYAWMKKRGQLGGQHKVPRVINDPDLLRDLCDFAHVSLT